MTAVLFTINFDIPNLNFSVVIVEAISAHSKFGESLSKDLIARLQPSPHSLFISPKISAALPISASYLHLCYNPYFVEFVDDLLGQKNRQKLYNSPRTMDRTHDFSKWAKPYAPTR